MLKSTAVVLCLATPALAQSPCDGRIMDKLDHPMNSTAVSKPAVGESYVDPVFGTLITRITDPDPGNGTSAVMKTLYNAVRGWNADGSMIIVWNRATQGFNFYQGDEPYALLGQVLFGGAETLYSTPADIEHLLWDPIDPNVMWYPSGNPFIGQPDQRLMKMTLNFPGLPAFEEVRLFVDECTAAGVDLYTPMSLGHVQDMSHSANKLVGLACGSFTTSQPRLHMLYSIAEDRVVGSYVSTETTPPWPFPSGTGAFRSTSGAIYNLNFDVVASADILWEHAAMASSPGLDHYVQVGFDFPNPEGTLISYNMATGQPTVIVGLENGWPYPKGDTHPSMGALNGSGWVAVSGVGLGHGQTVLDNELILANVGTGEVCRVAHLRTLADNGVWGYWSEPHPQISPDGYRVLFTSDWMGSNTVDTYVVDLRGDIPPLPTYTATLTWIDNADNEDGIRIERSPETLPRAFAQIGSVAANVTVYVDQPIDEGASFCWRLIAFNGGGDSAPSAEACATASQPVLPPISPSGLTADVTLVP